MFSKLVHPTSSIRQRHLESLHSKLFQTKTISIHELLNQEFLQQLLQYFTFEEVPSTIKALEILREITRIEQGCVILINLESLILLQQLRIILPSERMKEIVGEICASLLRVRSESTFFKSEQTQDKDASIVNQDNLHLANDQVIKNNNITHNTSDLSTIIRDVSAIHGKDFQYNQQNLNQTQVSPILSKSQVPQVADDHVNIFLLPKSSRLQKNDLFSEADDAYLFQLNVKLRQTHPEVAYEALDELEHFVLRDVNIIFFLQSRMDIIESVLLLLQSTLTTTQQQLASQKNPTIQSNQSTIAGQLNIPKIIVNPNQFISSDSIKRLDVRASECVDLLVKKLLMISQLEIDIALHIFHLIVTQSIPCLKKQECAPYIISYISRFLPFIELNANASSLSQTWILCLDLMKDWFQYVFSKDQQITEFIDIHIVDLFVKILSKFPPNILEVSTPSELRRALIICSQQPSIFIIYPSIYSAIGKIMEFIDTNAANDIQLVSASIQSFQIRDEMMTNVSIFEQNNLQNISPIEIEKEIQNLKLVLLSQVFDPNEIQRILHELFLIVEISSENESQLNACKEIFFEILKHPNAVVRSEAYIFLSDDLEIFISNLLNIDILVWICIDALSEDEIIIESAAHLLVSIFKRLNSTDKQYTDIFVTIVPLLQCLIQDGRSLISDISGIVSMLSDSIESKSISIEIYSRFLFHKQEWIRELAGAHLSKLIKYKTIYLDPFAKFFEQDTYHDNFELLEPRSLKSFDIESAKNVLRLFMSSSLDIRIAAEIASQISELIKVQRFRHLFATKEFLYFLLTSIENEKTAYIEFVEKCLVALRVLLHFEPRFRSEIRGDAILLTKICKNAFHTDLEIRLISCRVLFLLIFSPEIYTFNESSFHYVWNRCSEQLQNSYLPNGKHLPFISVPSFLEKGFFITRQSSTYNIKVKSTMVYPSISTEGFIRRLRHLQEKKVIDVVRGKESSSQFILQADIAFLKQCRNIDMYCIIKSRMHAAAIDASSLLEHISYLNTIWYMDPNKVTNLVLESDWRTAFGDCIEKIPTSAIDDMCILQCAQLISRVIQFGICDRDTIEYFTSVMSSNLFEQLVIAPNFWDDLPDQYYNNFMSNVLDRRLMRHEILKFLLSLVEKVSLVSELQDVFTLQWIEIALRTLSQYLDTRIFQNKHVFAITKAAEVIMLITNHTYFYTMNIHKSSHSVEDLKKMLNYLKSIQVQTTKLLTLLLNRKSFIGSELENYLIIIISNIGSIFASHSLSWVTDEIVQIIKLLLSDDSKSRKTFGIHILSQSIVNIEDINILFNLDALSSELITNLIEIILNSQSDLLQRDQCSIVIANILRLLVLHKDNITEDLLFRIGCNDLDKNLSPMMKFIVKNQLHIKFSNLLREENQSKCLEEIIVTLLQYISVDSKDLHPLLQDKYVIPFIVRFLSRPDIVKSESTLYFESRYKSQSNCKYLSIHLLHLIFSNKISNCGHFEELFNTSSTITLLIECLIRALSENESSFSLRFTSSKLLGLLLHTSSINPPGNFEKSLELKDYSKKICHSLISIYKELYLGNKFFSNNEKLIDETMTLAGAISILMSERSSTNQIAIELDFIKFIVSIIEQLSSSIQIEQASKKIHNIEHYKYYLYSNIRLLRSLSVGNLKVKESAVENGIMQHIKYLWSFSVSSNDETLKYELLVLILNIISSCPLAQKEFVSDVNIVSRGTNKLVLLDRLIKFTNNLVMQKNSFRLLFLIFRILSCLALGIDTRSLIIKLNIVEGYIKQLNDYIKAKDYKRIEIILHFLVCITSCKEGQGHVLKTKGLIDLLRCSYDVPHTRVKSHILLLIRNLSFEKQNKAFFLQDSSTLQFLVDCIIENVSFVTIEHRCIAASALWCLIYNNQKGRFMAQKLPSLNSRLVEYSEKLQQEFAILADGNHWNTVQIEKKKSDEYLLQVTISQLDRIINTIQKVKKEPNNLEL